MPLEVNISIKDEVSPTLSKLLHALGPEGMAEANDVAARDAQSYLKDYHRSFSSKGGWANPSLPTHGAGRKKSRFGEDVVRAWQVADSDSDGFTLTNNATGFAHKVTGGTITAKRASELTIPMVPEAHGVRAANYNGKLFRPKGKNYLMETDERGESRVVYLLLKSVKHKKVEGALPPQSALVSHVLESLSGHVEEALTD